MVNVVVKRSRWSRKHYENKLYVESTKRMCCLGFVARAAGFTVKDILNVAMPEDIKLDGAALKWKDTFGHYPHNSLYSDMSDINDNSTEYPRAEAEKKLTALAKRVGVRLKFVD